MNPGKIPQEFLSCSVNYLPVILQVKKIARNQQRTWFLKCMNLLILPAMI
jgi:hypothetical protein